MGEPAADSSGRVSLPLLLALAACVRGAYLAAAAAVGAAIPDYDTSASLLSESCADDWPAAAAAAPALAPGVVWDSVFLHRIAACGYEYEQFFAFFPGLPGVVRLLRSTGLLPGPWGFSIATLLLNNGLFLLSVFLLLRLSQRLLRDDRLAATAALIFIASPASIHHAMLYTEALFIAASWAGLYCLYCRRCSSAAALAFALSCATRSNGLLNAGFLLHEHGRRCLLSWQQGQPWSAVKQVLVGGAAACVSVAPYCAYMWYGYDAFCTGAYGPRGRHGPRPWCSNALPSAYGYVQDVYWDVGFLRYYYLDQIPNFLLASPTLAISLWGAAAYAAANPHLLATGGLLPAATLQRWFRGRRRQPPGAQQQQAAAPGACSRLPALTLGYELDKGQASGATAAAASAARRIPGVAYQPLRLRQQQSQQQSLQQSQQQSQHGVWRSPSAERGAGNAGASPPGAAAQAPDRPCSCGSGRGFYAPRVAVFVVHWAVLTAVALAVLHIQVATRFLSCCLPLYWFAALLALRAGRVLRAALAWYCFAFMGVGALLFVNFYPWT